MYLPSTKLWAAIGLLMLLSGCTSAPFQKEDEPKVSKPEPLPAPVYHKPQKPQKPKPKITPPDDIGIPVEIPTPLVPTPIIRPPVSEPAPTIEPSLGLQDYHIVLPGDNLQSLAKHYECSVADLKAWNDLEDEQLSEGQSLRVTPPPPPIIPDTDNVDTSPDEVSSSSGFHIVKPGETLQNVAERHGIAITDLAEWNGIGSPYTIYPGLILKLAPR
jgi:LysM repeat protein